MTMYFEFDKQEFISIEHLINKAKRMGALDNKAIPNLATLETKRIQPNSNLYCATIEVN